MHERFVQCYLRKFGVAHLFLEHCKSCFILVKVCNLLSLSTLPVFGVSFVYFFHFRSFLLFACYALSPLNVSNISAVICAGNFKAGSNVNKLPY